MIKPRIIVTGATGKTGSVVVTEVLKAGYPVRAMVRREDGRSARLKAQGAEVAVADMSDVERIADALKDVQGAYYCPPLDPYMIQRAVAFAVAAKEARTPEQISPSAAQTGIRRRARCGSRRDGRDRPRSCAAALRSGEARISAC